MFAIHIISKKSLLLQFKSSNYSFLIDIAQQYGSKRVIREEILLVINYIYFIEFKIFFKVKFFSSLNLFQKLL